MPAVEAVLHPLPAQSRPLRRGALDATVQDFALAATAHDPIDPDHCHSAHPCDAATGKVRQDSRLASNCVCLTEPDPSFPVAAPWSANALAWHRAERTDTAGRPDGDGPVRIIGLAWWGRQCRRPRLGDPFGPDQALEPASERLRVDAHGRRVSLYGCRPKPDQKQRVGFFLRPFRRSTRQSAASAASLTLSRFCSSSSTESVSWWLPSTRPLASSTRPG